MDNPLDGFIHNAQLPSQISHVSEEYNCPTSGQLNTQSAVNMMPVNAHWVESAFLVIDLDGTLLITDSFFESFIAILKATPCNIFKAFGDFLFGGISDLKCFLAPPPSSLSYQSAAYWQEIGDIIEISYRNKIILALNICSLKTPPEISTLDPSKPSSTLTNGLPYLFR